MSPASKLTVFGIRQTREMVKKTMNRIGKEEYLADPCRASSLPFWKTEQFAAPEGVSVFRDNEFDPDNCPGADERYFKLIHDLRSVPQPVLPDGYELTATGPEELAEHISACYTKEGVTAEELAGYAGRDVYDGKLWIAVRDRATGKIVASGIGAFDARIGEGILDWIQVSPAYRRRGLGRVIVCELLDRLSGKADFVTVSGRMDSDTDPFALYISCGFAHPVIWHVVRT